MFKQKATSKRALGLGNFLYIFLGSAKLGLLNMGEIAFFSNPPPLGKMFKRKNPPPPRGGGGGKNIFSRAAGEKIEKTERNIKIREKNHLYAPIHLKKYKCGNRRGGMCGKVWLNIFSNV